MPTQRPNILLVTSDQQHFSTMGSLNDRIRTPAIDRLCNEGVRFDRAYCPNPTCTPTRASIITGMYPSQHGAWTLGTKLLEDVPTVGQMLMRAGYFTALIGKAHFQPLRTREGFESIESMPLIRDLKFWREFHGPWYGFEHVEMARMHTCEHLVGQHYAIWMEEKGLPNWRDYFDDWPHNPEKCERLLASRHWALPEEFHYTHWTGERTIAQLEHAAEGDRPFFIWSSFHDPHPDYLCPEPWASMYNPCDMAPGSLTEGEHEKNPIHFRKTQEEDDQWWRETCRNDEFYVHGAHSHLHDPQELKKDIATYYGMVSFMDHEIGRILSALDRLGKADNTLVIFTSDHGHFLGQHGLIAKAIHHYEDLLRVPFVVRFSGRVPTGQTSNAIQNLVDLSPTFLATAGLEIPGAMTGMNQLPTWCGGKPVRTFSITENHHTPRSFHMRTYVNQRYKITVYRQGEDGELFDLQEDPGEINNLWHDSRSQQLKGHLLHEFMQATLISEPMRTPRIYGA